uniref:UDP-glucose glycoprotein:glucosyltransferase, putative n=1 Tax=Arundo donax TaxID=35708 RepID=A0A0A9H5W4_ARUDO
MNMQLFEAFCPNSPVKDSNWSSNVCARIHMVKVKEFRLFSGVRS